MKMMMMMIEVCLTEGVNDRGVKEKFRRIVVVVVVVVFVRK